MDSNLIIYACQANNQELRNWVIHNNPIVSIISKIETMGYHRIKAAEKLLLEALFEAAVVLPLTDAIAETAIALRQQKSMTLGDALIAATAIEHRLSLATANTKDFEHIENLLVVNPLTAH